MTNQQKSRFTRRRLAIGAASVAAAGLIVVPAIATASGIASGGTPSVTAAPAQSAPVEGRIDGEGAFHRARRGPQLARLAETLGIEVEELRAAMLAVRDVDGDGKPDRDAFESHDAFVAALAAELGIDIATVAAAPPDPAVQRIERLQTAADTLGVTLEALQAALEAAKDVDGPHDPGARLEAIAAELGVTVEALREALPRPQGLRPGGGPRGGVPFGADPEALGERLQEAVEAGKITQERADEILAAVESGERPQFQREPLTAEQFAERLQAAVESGKITQERADEILAAFEAGELSEGRPFGRRGGGFGGLRGGGLGGGFAPSGGGFAPNGGSA